MHSLLSPFSRGRGAEPRTSKERHDATPFIAFVQRSPALLSVPSRRLLLNQSGALNTPTGERSAAAEAMGRPKRGERRIDAAIDHLAQFGFPKPRIRKIINGLLKVYGRDGWMFLEEGSYEVVRNKLLDEQEQLEKQAAAAAAADKASPENDIEVSEAVHSEAPSEPQSALEPQASPNSSFPQEHVLPLPPAARLRLPCHGWISEESDTESEIEDEEMISDAPRPATSPKKDILNPAGTLPSKRKRPTRWDVRPNGV